MPIERQSQPQIHLAPMEGVVDFRMRDLYSRIGGFDQCITEFVRVTQNVNPAHIFLKYCPELEQGCTTESGTPVFVQLLGGNPELMAENAVRAAELGAIGIDINFGCPAKTVNRHDGGAALLQWPRRLHDITAAVRQAVPANIPVTTKMRLGFDDMSLALDNAIAVDEAGSNRLTIHARTKAQAYQPPAYWHELAAIRERVNLPMTANGEIWSVDDYYQCVKESGCDDIMLGRGAIACPDLALQIRAARGELDWKTLQWPEVFQLILQFFQLSVDTAKAEMYAISRLKQWLRQLAREYEQAEKLFVKAKRCRSVDEMSATLADNAQI